MAHASKPRIVGMIVLWAVAAGSALAAEKEQDRRGLVNAAMVKEAVAVDPAMKDPAWQKCAEMVLGDVGSAIPDKETTAVARVLFGPKHFYVAVTCKDDTDALKATVTERDGNVWNDDCVELFVSPDLINEGYFHFVFNAKGAVFDERCKGGEQDKSFNAKVEAKAAIDKGKGWTVVAAIPLADLGAWAGEDMVWRLNVTRTVSARGKAASKDTSWSTLGSANFHQPEAFGRAVGVTIPKLADGVNRQRDPGDDPEKFVPKAAANETRLNAVADIWVSDGFWEGVNEKISGMGKSRHFKIKSIQEFACVRFDVAPAVGREVKKATLYLRRDGSDKLRYIRTSTINQDWTEGDTADDYGPGSGGCFSFADFATKKPWAWEGSEITDVVMSNGNSLDAWAECQKMHNGWVKVDIDPKLIYAMIAGDTDGLCVMDGGTLLFTNNFIHSVQSKGYEPFLLVELGEPITTAPAAPKVTVETAPERSRLSGGAIKITIATDPAAFSYRVQLDGKDVARWRVHHPAKGAPTVFYLDELPSEKDLKVQVAAVGASGKASSFTTAGGTVSAALKNDRTLGKFTPPGAGAAPPEVAGKMRVWPAPPMVKIAPDKPETLQDDAGTKGSDVRKANAVWDGKKIGLFGARGEYVSYQLVIERLGGPLAGVKVAPAELKGPGGATIGGSEIELFKNWYALNGANAWQPAYCVPLAAGAAFEIPEPKRQGSVQATVKQRGKPDLTIESKFPEQQNQTVVVDVYVPKDAKPGKYAGSIAVSAEGVEAISLPVELEVFDFALPDKLSFWPELNAYQVVPTSYYVLAHQHRCVVNGASPGPQVSGAGKDMKVDWTKYDQAAGPLLDGSAFKNTRRAGVPIPVMYLPYADSWPTPLSQKNYAYNGPWGGGEEIVDRHYLNAPYIGDGLSQEYKDAFLAVQKQFVEHFKEKGWNNTEMQCFYGGKATHRSEYNVNMWWTTDEPYHLSDWLAVQFFNRLWADGRKAVGADPKIWVARSDISRPNWEGRMLEGIIDTQYGAMGTDLSNRRLRILHEETGVKINDYGSANGDADSNTQSVVLLMRVWLNGGNAHLPWQTIGSDMALDVGDRTGGGGNALLVPGKRFGLDVVGDYRLKALREGQQIIEYMTILAERTGMKREQIDAMLAKSVDISFGWKKGASLEDADAKKAATLRAWEIAQLRQKLAEMIVKAKP